MEDDLIPGSEPVDTTAQEASAGEPAAQPEVDSDAELLAAVSEAIDAETPEDVRAAAAEGATDDQPEAKPDGKPADAPAADEKPADKPAEADPVNDPIPDEIKGRTRERMETLVSRVKETTQELEKVRANHDEFMGMITATQASPEQFGTVLDYLGAVNSGDPEQRRGAMKILQDEIAALSQMLGEPVAGVDLLKDHQDLKDAVEIGDISQEHANELAAARNARATAQRRQQETQQTQQQASEQQRAFAQGKADLNAVEAELSAKDPHYAAKRAVLIETLKPVMARLHPKDWAETFRQAYAAVQVPATPAAPARTTQQPLRARQGAGGQEKAPGSLEEAISMGIERAGR